LSRANADVRSLARAKGTTAVRGGGYRDQTLMTSLIGYLVLALFLVQQPADKKGEEQKAGEQKAGEQKAGEQTANNPKPGDSKG
jgi:hypothetical protein